MYCACCLGNHEVGKLGHEVQPHFYVNVADIETLESEVAYIACRCIPSIYNNVYLFPGFGVLKLAQNATTVT